jgi:hypothetical protein
MKIKLTDDEMKMIFSCLKAACEGPFFPDWEIHSLMGFEKEDIKNFLKNVKEINWEDKETEYIVNNVIVNLLWYPHGENKILSEYISAPKEHLLKLFNKLKGGSDLNKADSSARKYFDNII